MMIRVGWLLVGFLFGLVGTIMVAVLTVEHQQEEDEKRREKEK